MFKSLAAAAVLSTAIVAPTVAFADDAPKSDITITGSADITTQYRLRGISQTDDRGAIQGGITISHVSGFYIGTWASNLAGHGTPGGANMELDLIAGYTKAAGPVTFDGGVVYYVYPGTPDGVVTTSGVDYVELYASGTVKVGPGTAKLGTYWTPKQDHIGGHNIWIYTDWAFPIPKTPLTLHAHGGYSTGTSAYTNGALAGIGHEKGVWDYGVGMDFTYKNLTLNVSYVGTNLSREFADTYFGGGNRSGYSITRGNVVGTLTASF